MFENRHPVSVSYEPLPADSAEAPWVECNLNTEPTAVYGKRILLVDDEEPIRACLRMMLELDGHQITEASNGAAALTLFNIDDFDLIITDFEMPMMKGNELAIGIKQLAPSLPILMITASARARRDAGNPVDALLDKPFTIADLRSALGKLLRAPGQPAEPSLVPIPENSSVVLEQMTCC
jgi:CheY-like chemotaxis protein